MIFYFLLPPLLNKELNIRANDLGLNIEKIADLFLGSVRDNILDVFSFCELDTLDLLSGFNVKVVVGAPYI